MISIFKKKRSIDPLYEKWTKLQGEAIRLYKINRVRSEELLVQSYEVVEEMKQFRKAHTH